MGNVMSAKSWLNRAELTELPWPTSICKHLPLLAFYVLTVLSVDSDRITAEYNAVSQPLLDEH